MSMKMIMNEYHYYYYVYHKMRLDKENVCSFCKLYKNAQNYH